MKEVWRRHVMELVVVLVGENATVHVKEIVNMVVQGTVKVHVQVLVEGLALVLQNIRAVLTNLLFYQYDRMKYIIFFVMKY